MIRFYLLFLFVGFVGHTQSLELKIDSISVEDSDVEERRFTMHFHLKNLTDERIRFFQDFSRIVPSTGGSGTDLTFYKIYENDAFLEIGGFLSGCKRTMIRDVDSLTVQQQKKLDTLQNEKVSIVSKMVTMVPREILSFSIGFCWNRNRYHQYQDMEYYLEEEANHFFEITMVLLKTRYKNELPENLYKEIIDDKYFIEGVFTSNKMKIDFGEKKSNASQ